MRLCHLRDPGRFTDEERRIITACDTPEKVQAFIEKNISYNWEEDGVARLRSFRRVVRDRVAHCSNRPILTLRGFCTFDLRQLHVDWMTMERDVWPAEDLTFEQRYAALKPTNGYRRFLSNRDGTITWIPQEEEEKDASQGRLLTP
ncbi:MAG: hypothetical protein AAB728_05140 [Patescibacteria group bacterium]